MQRRKGGGGVNISRISIGRVYNLGIYNLFIPASQVAPISRGAAIPGLNF